MNNSPSKKPSLLSGSDSGPGSDSGNTTGSVRVLATLDRRNLRDAGAHRIHFGNRRSAQHWRLWLAALLCGLVCVGIALYVIHPTIDAAQGVVAMSSNVSKQQDITAVMLRDHSSEVNTEARTDTATIINAPINTSVSVTTTETATSSGLGNSSVRSTAADTKKLSAAAKQVAVIKATSPKAAPAPRAPSPKRAAPANIPPAAASSDSTNDSDVDLLAALIARARQRDPTPDTQQNAQQDAKQEPPCIATAKHSCKP